MSPRARDLAKSAPRRKTGCAPPAIGFFEKGRRRLPTVTPEVRPASGHRLISDNPRLKEAPLGADPGPTRELGARWFRCLRPMLVTCEIEPAIGRRRDDHRLVNRTPSADLQLHTVQSRKELRRVKPMPALFQPSRARISPLERTRLAQPPVQANSTLRARSADPASASGTLGSDGA